MPRPPRPYVDPSFPRVLRELREARGLSLRDLSRITYFAKSTLSMLEAGQRRPSLDAAHTLDAALDAQGALARRVHAPPQQAQDALGRIEGALMNPRAIDPRSVSAFADVLAAQRRLDDTLGPHLLLPAIAAQHDTLLTLARDARGPAANGLYEVAAEWTQFHGWLHAEARNDTQAAALLDEAAVQAIAIGHGPLTAQARNFRGYVERQRRQPRAMVRHFTAAYDTPGATVLQRVGDAAQAAHGHGLLGDTRTAVRLLGQASDLLTTADGDEPPGTAYWLSPTFSRLNIGLAYIGLGRTADAADSLRTGLAGLPAEWENATWAAEYRRALDDLENCGR
jgi:transcriptional regulator with XRE-family HTH domain